MKLKFPMYCLIFTWSHLSLFGQVGFLVSGTNHLFNPLGNGDNLEAASFKHADAGISYGLGLKNIRLEFHPNLTLGYGKGDFLDAELTFKQISATISFPITFYPLDFANGCNCPTFNKNGEVFEKGLFIMIQPGLSHVWRTIENLEAAQKREGFQPELGLGIGFDIGLSKNSTLSPYIILARTFNGYFEFSESQKIWEKSADHMNLELGFRYLWYSKRIR